MNIIEPTPSEYFKRCVTNSYADFDGRARRAEYWYFYLFLILSYLPFMVLAIIGATLDSPALAIIGAVLAGLVGLALFLPSLAVTVRRLHDTNKSGWFYLLVFIPFGSIVLFVFMLLEGDRGANQYGPDPKMPVETDITDHLQVS